MKVVNRLVMVTARDTGGVTFFFSRGSFNAALSRIASELFRLSCLSASSGSATRPAYVEYQGLKRHRDVAFWPLP
ncbi:MAG: hypothetical protein ACRED2_09365, partial [Methylocella sp.]